jgi:hypothetical protein
MKNSNTNQAIQSRGRNIALGAAFGLVIGGLIDLLTGDTGWGLVIGILCGALIGYFVKFNLPLMEYPAQIIRRMVIAVVLFLVSLFLSRWLLDQDLSQVLQLFAAALPALPGAFMAYAIGSAIAQLDELQRRIQLEAIGIGFAISALASLTYASLVQVGAPQVSWMFVPLLLVVSWGLGKLWTMWKYR